MNQNWESLTRAYPSYIENEVKLVLGKIDLKPKRDPSDFFTVIVRGESLEIPYRIYYEQKNLLLNQDFTPLQNEILNCLYTRHHDGFVREQCLRKILNSENIWVVPYVVQLIGEYVIEILQVIKEHLPEINVDLYKEFLLDNYNFYKTTKRRVMSYWDCYYRSEYYKRDQYPGFQILEFLDGLLK